MNRFYILVIEKDIEQFDIQISENKKDIKYPKMNEYYITKSDILIVETDANKNLVLAGVKMWLKKYFARPLTIECTNEIIELINLFL